MKPLFILLISLSSSLFSAGQQLRNSNFETWVDSVGQLFPDGWTADQRASIWLSPSTNVRQGTYSLVLSTWYSYVEGHLFYGIHQKPFGKNWKDYAVPFESRPLKLSGFYRYIDLVNPTDSAMGELLIKDMAGDTVAYGNIFFKGTENWKKFEIPLTYHPGREPASIAIHFVSNVHSAGLKEDNSYPNRLYLDHFKLLYKEKD